MSEHLDLDAIRARADSAEFMGRDRSDMRALITAVARLRRDVDVLTADRDRALDESATAYSQGVEDMRKAAMRAASDALGTPWTPTEAIRDVKLSAYRNPALWEKDPLGGERLRDDVAQLQSDIKRVKEASGTCPSFTADPAHPGDALYCEHPSGEGHSGHHFADTWGWSDATEPDETPGGQPAPRDSDLARTLREQMKRYGAPAVMAEAARLCQQRL